MALKNSGLKKGDHIAVNGYTCYAVYDAVTAAGLVPHYVDIAKGELNFSAKQLEAAAKVNKKLKGVIIQNTLGTPVDMKAIEKVVNKRKMYLLEDLAHCIGMKYADGREAGTVADAALSFSQDKVVDAVSGGAYIYRSGEFDEKIKSLSYRRFLKDYYYIWNTMFIRSGYIWGGGKIYAYFMTKLRLMPRPMDGEAEKVRKPDVWHATLAQKQFNDLNTTTAHRNEIADFYAHHLPDKIKLKHYKNANYLRYPILVDDPAGLIAHLKKSGIFVSDTWYDAPISPKRHLADTDYEDGMCPNAEDVASRMVNLPTHINVDEMDAEKITAKVNEWLSKQDK